MSIKSKRKSKIKIRNNLDFFYILVFYLKVSNKGNTNMGLLSKSFEGGIKTVNGKKILIIDHMNQVFRFLHVAYKNNPLDEEWLDWQYFMINMLYG